MMKKLLLSLLIVMTSATIAMAQQPKDRHDEDRHDDRRPGIEQFMNDKTSFMLREMQLSKQDSARFVPLYKDLQKEKFELMKRFSASNWRLRKMLKQSPAQPVPDSLYLKVVEAEYQQNLEDARLEQRYLRKFEKILSPRQLYRYLKAEKHFKRTFMNGGDREPRKDQRRQAPDDSDDRREERR